MLVGVTGYARHGKDTIAGVLVREYGYTRIALADALKDMALTLNPIVATGSADIRLDWFVREHGWEVAKGLPEVRRFLQVLGTEAVRGTFGDNAWIDALKATARKQEVNPDKLVVPDIRFPNEAQFIEENRGEVWSVVRVNEDDGRMYDNGIGKDHPSEAFIGTFGVDREFVADSVEMLEAQVRGTMRQVMVGWTPST